jgi:hypothetical protein
MLLLESNYIIFSGYDNSQNRHTGDLDTQDLSSVRVYPQAIAYLLSQIMRGGKNNIFLL